MVGTTPAVIKKRATHVVCSEHFTDNDYYCPTQRQTSTLLPSATPSLKLYKSQVCEIHIIFQQIACNGRQDLLGASTAQRVHPKGVSKAGEGGGRRTLHC